MAKNTLDGKREANSLSYVIGIGASAGGMEAIHDLFEYMPANTGFSFVVVQHLSPDHKSLTAELLAKHTPMRVREAVADMAIEPDNIYVIPNKSLITIRKGKLQLHEKLKSRVPNHAVDTFFESLAEDQKEKAAGIILSGTGTDGTKGLQAIKKQGGMTLVQDPLTAAFDGMPNSAVESGAADLILPPEMMGDELVEYIKESPMAKSLSTFSQDDENTLRDILSLLNKVTRHDFNHYKRPTLFRRLAKRMSERGINELVSYRDYLQNNEEEVRILSREFLINVTKFFRDPEAFEYLRTEVVHPILSSKRPDETVKVWSAACSSGEEAYSVGILFLEQMGKMNTTFPHIKIFATDIDTEALETASRGVYPKEIERDVPPEFLQKYFTREGNTFRVIPDLRKLVVFASHNVAQDPPFSRLDLITCRNMFIYMNSTLQRKAMRKFHFALNINGFIMLGPSENIGLLKDATQEVNRKWKIYRCLTKRLADTETMFAPLENSIFPKMSLPAKQNVLHPTDILKETLLEDRNIALILIDRDFNVKQAVGTYKSFVNFPDDNFNFNLLRMVPSDLAVALGVAIRKAIIENAKCVMKNIVIHDAENTRQVNVIVKPYLQKPDHNPFVAIVIEDSGDAKPLRNIASNPLEHGDQVLALEAELRDTRENLQAVIEEMETVNEELQSSNEEMISTNEELQSTNEELQSLNEELHTVSAEHQLKIKELFELNDDLNNYFNNSEIGQVLVDENLVVRKFTPSVKKMINLIEADIGRSINDITTNLKGVRLSEEIAEVIARAKAAQKEVQTSDDQHFLMRITPYVKRDKGIEGAVINFIDISHSKRLTSIIEGIFESSPNGITAKRAIRDDQGKIFDFEYLAINRAAEKMFKAKPGNLLGRRLLKVFPDEGLQYAQIYARVVETGIPSTLEFYHASSNTWYETTVVKMLDGVVTTHSDITDRKKSADLIAQNFEDLKEASKKLTETNVQLERSNFDLMQFASVASHDLKEPLRKIQAFGNILQSKIKGKLSDTEVNYFSKIIIASNRMQTLIDDVLTLSKLSNGTLMKEKTDLNKIIRQITEDLEITVREKNAVVEIGPLPSLDAVPGQMHQVFQNLISNALKFSNKKSPVISITQEAVSDEQAADLGIDAENYTYIVVADNGIGFEDKYKEKIFGIFQRLHGRNYEGTGIGLAIARKIIENHGGLIFANGKVNKGATFHILLPLDSMPQPFANINVKKPTAIL